jgi:CheY-like chemotaxis protein
MSSTVPVNAGIALSASSAPQLSTQSDRRRRKRAKITAQVLIKVADSIPVQQEVCTSIDVSRDGLLVTASRCNYSVGQTLAITFPYSVAANDLNRPEPAEVVRVTPLPGNRFAVAFQFVAAKTVQSAAISSPALATNPLTHNSQQPLVLAVEPDPRSAEMMRTILQQDGYAVVVVATANEALEVLKGSVPAVFVAEVEAKDMSGHDLCLIVKRNDRLKHVPVILLTKSAQPADYAASHQLGAVVCMAKPFKPERLLHVVRLVAPPPVKKDAYATRLSSNQIERTI